MFHRANTGVPAPEKRETVWPQNKKILVEQSAVERYAKTGRQEAEQDVPPANDESGTLFGHALAPAPAYVQDVQQQEARQDVRPQLQTHVPPAQSSYDHRPRNGNIQQPSYQPPTQQQKDTEDMNIIGSETKTQDSQSGQGNNASAQSQNRMDIPGTPGAFQRPGQPQAAGTVGRGNTAPSYPGAYPGAASPASSTSASYVPQASAASDIATGRKLVIGPGITLSGEIESCDHLIVDGTVEAALKGASVMDITETGAFYGTVEIDEATIAGRFEGELTVKGRLTVRASGSITGAIAYKELAVEAGATLDGKITPLGAKAQGQQPSRKAQNVSGAGAKTSREELFSNSKSTVAAE